MDGVNQNQQAQQQAPTQQTKPEQQAQKVSEKQSSDFADRVGKDKNKDKKTEEKKGDQSLESLLAERNKNSREAIEGRSKDQKGDGQQDRKGEGESQLLKNQNADMAMLQGTEAQLKADHQIREMQQTSSIKEVNATMQKLADQIQVSAKGAINGAEVRITLKDNILPGTEIRIQRHGGELTVTLNTTSAEANNFLAQHEASLQKTLAERFSNEKVQVNINMSGGDNSENDGRSREEYIPEQEQDNED